MVDARMTAHNAAVRRDTLLQHPDSLESLIILHEEGEDWLATCIIAVSSQMAGNQDLVAYLVSKRPHNPCFYDIVAEQPTDPAIEAMIIEAKTAGLEISTCWQALYAQIDSVAKRIEADTPGADSADTGVV